MQTRRAKAGMAMSTRAKGAKRESSGKDELLAYVSLPQRRRTPASGIVKKTDSRSSQDVPVASTSRSRRALPAAPSSSKPSSSIENVLLRARAQTPADTSGTKSKLARATVSLPTRAISRSLPTQTSPRKKPAKSLPEPLGDATVAKRTREALDEEMSSFREESEKEERALKRRKLAVEKQEKQLKTLEQKLNLRTGKLDEREAFIRQREEETQRYALNVDAEVAARMLQHMEESFSCALCCDIMACPTSLTSHCGHTFCAICITTWYFSKFHAECRSWHASVECPLCRASIRTPNTSHIPRNVESCPFSPNRVAEAALQQIADSLAAPLLDATVGSGKGKKKKVVVIDVDDPALEWRTGGTARVDWVVRSQRGKAKREEIVKGWERLGPSQFLALKQSLDA